MSARAADLAQIDALCGIPTDIAWVRNTRKGGHVSTARHLDHLSDGDVRLLLSALVRIARRLTGLTGGMSADALGSAYGHLAFDVVRDIEQRFLDRILAHGSSADSDLVLHDREQFADLLGLGLEQHLAEANDDCRHNIKGNANIRLPNSVRPSLGHLVIPALIAATVGCAAAYIARKGCAGGSA